MEKQIKLFVKDWGYGNRYLDCHGKPFPKNQKFIISEKEAETIITNDYNIRLAEADNSVKGLIWYRSLQEILNEMDDMEYNNDRRHKYGKENLVSNFRVDDPLMKTMEKTVEYELERACLPRAEDIKNKVYPFLTVDERVALDEIIIYGRMSRKELASSRQVCYATVENWLERVKEVITMVTKDEITDLGIVHKQYLHFN